MKRLKIREAITAFNVAARDTGKTKMTLERLAGLTFKPSDKIRLKTGLRYLSDWDRGKNMDRLEAKYINRARKALGVAQEDQFVDPASHAA